MNSTNFQTNKAALTFCRDQLLNLMNNSDLPKLYWHWWECNYYMYPGVDGHEVEDLVAKICKQLLDI